MDTTVVVSRAPASITDTPYRRISGPRGIRRVGLASQMLPARQISRPRDYSGDRPATRVAVHGGRRDGKARQARFGPPEQRGCPVSRRRGQSGLNFLHTPPNIIGAEVETPWRLQYRWGGNTRYSRPPGEAA